MKQTILVVLLICSAYSHTTDCIDDDKVTIVKIQTDSVLTLELKGAEPLAQEELDSGLRFCAKYFPADSLRSFNSPKINNPSDFQRVLQSSTDGPNCMDEENIKCVYCCKGGKCVSKVNCDELWEQANKWAFFQVFYTIGTQIILLSVFLLCSILFKKKKTYLLEKLSQQLQTIDNEAATPSRETNLNDEVLNFRRVSDY